MADNPSKQNLISYWETYRYARLNLLNKIGIAESNKDPMSEFSEVLVSTLLGGKRAENRVQKGYDVLVEKERVQVKYLANPENKWINWHTIKFNEYMDKYALVYYEKLNPKAIFIFKVQNLSRLCQLLGKKHKNQDSELQFTKTNYLELINNPEKYVKEGVDVIILNK